ncbi:right-handed parallel beta-helix repeat-containing protein [candidate division KSB1 bacterium]|nr:right-handed parallel beta-helix repeat-containing protein [candidate division KSB1 bacterium]
MRNFWILLLVLAISCGSQRSPRSTFYVSPTGDDSWSGRLAETNRSQTDGPFQTLERARSAVRDYRDNQPTDAEIVVTLMPGEYHRKEAFILDEQDSGHADQPLVWRGSPNGRSRLLGSIRLGLHAIDDSALIARLPQSARSAVRQVELPDEMILPDRIEPRGTPPLQLFYGGKSMPLAGYPQKGWLRIADVPQNGAKRYHEGLEREKRYDGVPVGRHYGRIRYDADRPSHWKAWENIVLHGYWTWDWSDSYQAAASIDTNRREITLAEPHHNYGYTKNQRFRFVNILEELDAPGEWVWDQLNRRVYFYAPDDDASEVEITVCRDPLMHLRGCAHIRVEGIDLSASRGNGIRIDDASDILIANCQFTGLGDHAVEIHGGERNGVQSCDIHTVARGGIVLEGGDRKILAPGSHYAVNNHIRNYSTWIRTWQLAVDVNGVGHRVANNLIHDAPHEAIYVRGNDHVIEYNEIHSVCLETGDAGAIHTGRDYTWRGNIFRYNFIHDLQGAGLHGVTALYLDDFSSGYSLYGNLCVRSGRGTLIGGGRDNRIHNNIFVECQPSIILDGRGLSWAGYYFDGTYPVLFDKMAEMNAQEPPYSTRYPELLTIDPADAAVPVNNRIENNISIGGRFIELYDYHAYDTSVNTIRSNWVADSIICKLLAESPEGWDPYYLDLDRLDGYRLLRTPADGLPPVLADNHFFDRSPIVFDAERMKIRFVDTKALELKYELPPVDRMGLQVDAFRR